MKTVLATSGRPYQASHACHGAVDIRWRDSPTLSESRIRTPSAAHILDAVRAIPEGFVRTYGDLAPGAPRFAGRVLHETTEDVPWWRVVRADGSLPVGEAQRVRLDAEGVPLLATNPPRVDMRTVRLPD
jgi:methylated-DNA-protein-cysteine methyltransferase related protein